MLKVQKQPTPDAYYSRYLETSGMTQIGVIRNVGFETGNVVGKRTVRLPAGSVADAASNPAYSSPRLGAPLWECTSPHRASTGKTLKSTL